MTQEEFELLSSEEARELIRKNIHSDPLKFALSYKSTTLPVSSISTQLKYLQRAKVKLPSYYQALCVIPPLSYEQSSSEAAAGLKDYSGDLCLDLTAGLGVDSYHFSRNFRKVISLELSPVLATITTFNFNLLGASNIELINTSAEQFLAQYKSEKFDLIFVDPARRDDSKNRVFLFEDCSPNLYEIFPVVAKLTRKFVVKASPLFDNTEAWRRFPELNKLAVVSVDNECKEILLEFDFEKTGTTQTDVVLLSRKGKEYQFSFERNPASDILNPVSSDTPLYLLEPDVAFYKGRTCPQLFSKYFDYLKAEADQEDGYFYTNEDVPLTDFPGRVFKITAVIDYQPKTIKKTLKQMGISKANVSKRNFPVSVEDIRKALHITDGGTSYLFFTKTTDGKHKVILTEKRT